MGLEGLNEQEIAERAARRRQEREQERLAVSGAGYSPAELPVALNIKKVRDAWYSSAQAEQVNNRIADWAKELTEQYQKLGKDPLRHKYFHALIGSTPTAGAEYDANPDLPEAENSVLALVERLKKEFGEPKA